MPTEDNRLPVIFLMGPTASGKTQLAIHLAGQLPCDIVSVDSAMVYRGMDIGTAKPEAQVLARAPHRLIDIRDPADTYNAAAFRADASHAIDQIHACGRIPLLAGGSMLYFSALEHGLSPLPRANPAIRTALAAEAETLGWPALHQRLAAADAVTAARIHPNDSQRIQRALEILMVSGRSPSQWYAQDSRPQQPWHLVKLALAPADRQILQRRVAQRFRSMLEAGFLAEVEKLHARPDLDLQMPAMRAVGYRQLWRHLEDEWTLPEAEERGIIATRQLAKRQLTWLRRESAAQWLDSMDDNRFDRAVELIRKHVAKCNSVL